MELEGLYAGTTLTAQSSAPGVSKLGGCKIKMWLLSICSSTGLTRPKSNLQPILKKSSKRVENAGPPVYEVHVNPGHDALTELTGLLNSRLVVSVVVKASFSHPQWYVVTGANIEIHESARIDFLPGFGSYM